MPIHNSTLIFLHQPEHLIWWFCHVLITQCHPVIVVFTEAFNSGRTSTQFCYSICGPTDKFKAIGIIHKVDYLLQGQNRPASEESVFIN